MLEQSILRHKLINDCYNSIKAQYQLTKREFQVMKYLTVFGQNNLDLGTSLRVSEKTIKNHIANIYSKTNTRSSRDLQALVLRETTQWLLERTIQTKLLQFSSGYEFQCTNSSENNLTFKLISHEEQKK